MWDDWLHMADRTTFAKNTGFQLVLQIAKYVFPFMTLPYLTRSLGPSAYAVRSYILAAMGFVMVFLDYGFASYGIRAIAEVSGNGDAERLESSAITYARLFFCGIGAFAVAIITAFIPIMAANPLYVAISYLTVCAKTLLPDFYFQGKEDMAIITNRFVLSEGVATALIFLLIKSADDLLWVPIIETIGAVIALVLSWENAVRAYHIVPVPVTLPKVLQVIRDSTTFFVATAATTIFSCLTTLFIGYFITDDAEISYWSIAMSAIGAVQALFSPIVNSLYPHMVHERDFKLLKFLLVLGVPVDIIGTIAFALLKDVVMFVLGGAQYMDGAYVIALVAPMLLFSYPAVLLGYPVLAAVGWIKELTITSVISAVFHIVGLFVLAACGIFTLRNVCLLRCCTELVLMVGRIYYVLKYLREQRATT